MVMQGYDTHRVSLPAFDATLACCSRALTYPLLTAPTQVAVTDQAQHP